MVTYAGSWQSSLHTLEPLLGLEYLSIAQQDYHGHYRQDILGRAISLYPRRPNRP